MRNLVTIAVALAMLAAVGDAAARAAKGKLEGFQEVPAIYSPGQGKCVIKPGDGQLAVTLEYAGLLGSVTQAHIHFGQLGVNGGIMVFLCTNLGNGPAGTPSCPVSGTVTRTIGPSDVIGGASAQGVAVGDFAAVAAAVHRKTAYCNVHSDLFPGGEIRGQLK